MSNGEGVLLPELPKASLMRVLRCDGPDYWQPYDQDEEEDALWLGNGVELAYTESALRAYGEQCRAQGVVVPPEAVRVEKGALFIPEGNWVIEKSFCSLRVVDERFAYGWNECRKAMIAATPTPGGTP